jgi:hypothetical protein
MAPVVQTLALILAAASAVEAAPPGRHAPPSVANMLSNVKRNWNSLAARWYYGDEYGLVGVFLSHSSEFALINSNVHLIFPRNVNSLSPLAGPMRDVLRNRILSDY